MSEAPTSVYQYFNSKGKLLYVGVTARGIRRAKEHAATKEWWPLASGCSLEHYDTRGEALNRERDLIVTHCPPFNTVHSPDKDLADSRAKALLGTADDVDDELSDDEAAELDRFELEAFSQDVKARRSAYYLLPKKSRQHAPCVICLKPVTGKRDGPSCRSCHQGAGQLGLNAKRSEPDRSHPTGGPQMRPSTKSNAGSLLRANYTEPVEARTDSSGTTMVGHFSVFDTWYEINSVFEGRFLERVVPGAFAETFKRDRDRMRVLYDHGMDPALGNKPLGPIDELEEDHRGAWYAVPLLDTDYNRNFVLPAMRGQLMNGDTRGSQLGASFRFQVGGDSWVEKPKRSNHNPDGIPERSIELVSVFEFGPVTFGASPTATSGIRSLTDEFIERLNTDPMYVARLTERAGLGVVERILSEVGVADQGSERSKGGVADQPTSNPKARMPLASALTQLTALGGKQ